MNRIYLLFVFITLSAAAQQKRVETSIDTTKNKIGAQFNLTLKTTVDTLSTVVFPTHTTFGNLEVIRNYAIDTIAKNSSYELVKRYGLAQFDSGKYTIPRLRVLINKQPHFSDAIIVEVSDVKVDTLQQKMYDIKPIIEADSNRMSPFLKYALILLLILGIAALLYWIIKRSQAKKAEKAQFRTPIERATSLLQTLEKKELWQKGEIKTYYSELTDIARNYIEEAIHIPAMESTTSELIDALRDTSVKKKMTISDEVLKNFEKVLKQADLVKFAKSQPLDFEIADHRQKIESAIVTLDQSVPEMSDDEVLFREIQLEKMLKRQRRNRILITVATILLLLIGTTIYFVATRGFDFVKDNVIGHPTKDLIEGEWISSEYGNPAISIETPKVLTRVDSEKVFPKQSMALLKEFQAFGYGSMLDNFYVVVATNTYKGEAQIDLDKGIEGMIKAFELQGAQNVLVKKDDYQTSNGITGLKAYGSFTIVNPQTKDKKQAHYEALLFGQQNGLQQIMIIHEDDDKYAEQITERILNSVELKKISE